MKSVACANAGATATRECLLVQMEGCGVVGRQARTLSRLERSSLHPPPGTGKLPIASRMTQQVVGTVGVVNRIESPFGAGWNLRGHMEFFGDEFSRGE